jgi:DNA-binding beta-propeller fold protein YncE
VSTKIDDPVRKAGSKQSAGNRLLIAVCFSFLTLVLFCSCSDMIENASAALNPPGSLIWLGNYNSPGSGPEKLVVSPDGRNVYVALTNAHAIVWFRRNWNGSLVYQGNYCGPMIAEPWSLVVSPDGRNVYVAAKAAGALAWFSRDSAGALSFGGSFSDPAITDNIYNVAVSPDGKSVYAAAWGDGGVVSWFTRNLSDGSLSYTAGNIYSNDTVFTQPASIAVSADGRHVYVGANFISAILCFTRNVTDGSLTLVSSYPDTLAAVRNTTVALSPDGKNVYRTSFVSNTVSWFLRDEVTGALTLSGWYTSDMLDGIFDVAVSPDGKYVYAVSNIADAVTWFIRAADGSLVYAGKYSDASLVFTRSVAISPDGHNAYVAAVGSSTVAWFSINK